MKRLVLAALSTVALSPAFASVLHAQTVPQATPIDVVNLARNGYFKDQGVPSHSGLEAAYNAGQLGAEDLVKAAIEQNRISADTLKDEAFLNTVETFLRDSNDR